jgi:hypothetical protein
VEPLGSSKYRLISSANRNNLISSFPIYIPFISFSCLIALAKSPTITLNKSVESGQPYLGPDFRGKAFSLSTFSIMLAIASHIWPQLYDPSIPNLFKAFIMKGCLIF